MARSVSELSESGNAGGAGVSKLEGVSGYAVFFFFAVTHMLMAIRATVWP